MHTELSAPIDSLPAIGSKVKIHIPRPDYWIEHTVVGYYTSNNPLTNESNIFVRAMDASGFLTAREVNQIKC